MSECHKFWAELMCTVLIIRERNESFLWIILQNSTEFLWHYCFPQNTMIPRGHWSFIKVSLLCPGRGAEYCNQFVCLCVCLVCEQISGSAGPIFTKFCVQILCGRGLVLIWRHCDTSGLWMTSRLAVVGHMVMRGRLNL